MKNNILLNPFAVISDKKQTTIGIVSFILGIAIAYYTNVNVQILRIDPIKEISLIKVVINEFIIVALLTVAFFGLGKIINKKTRLIDILNTVLISLIPVYLGLFQNINGYLNNQVEKMLQSIQEGTIREFSTPFLFVLISIIGIVLFIYYIYLLFIGFKTATNAKKAWHYVLFFTTLIVVDIIASILINSIK